MNVQLPKFFPLLVAPALGLVLALSLLGSMPRAEAGSRAADTVPTVGVALTPAAVIRAAALPRPVARMTGGCANGRCTIYLNQADTIALSRGRVPAPPSWVSGPLRVAYYAMAYGHVLVAKGWVARRTCVAFRVDIRPWASQGMLGWRCAWR